MIDTKLVNASLMRSKLLFANLGDADLRGADLSESWLGWTTFGENDLSTVSGLDAVVHSGPSALTIQTIYRSGGSIPESFLRAVEIPDVFIRFIPSLIEGVRPIQHNSCFISYSSKDEDFAKQLYARLKEANLRVFFAPEDLRGGLGIYELIERAIRLNDKVLLVLSENSLKSEWVISEMRKARRIGASEGRRKLFPIRLVNMERLREWECFDADTGKDLAVELREYFIPDFSNWREPDAFDASFSRLLRDLQADEINVSSSSE